MLKDDFLDILEQYGHNVLVVRQSKKLKCSCWTEKYQEADKECPVCFGLGTVPVIEKHTVRSQTMTIPQTLPRAVSDLSLGSMEYSGNAYYMRPDIPISVGDLIVEVDWSATGKPIYTGDTLSEVNYVDPKRFEHGETIFKKVYVSGTSVDRKIRGIRIANSSGVKNYELIRGVQDGHDAS